jgi:hypothetical protein
LARAAPSSTFRGRRLPRKFAGPRDWEDPAQTSVSLAPLDFETAPTALFKVKPEKKQK